MSEARHDPLHALRAELASPLTPDERAASVRAFAAALARPTSRPDDPDESAFEARLAETTPSGQG